MEIKVSVVHLLMSTKYQTTLRGCDQFFSDWFVILIAEHMYNWWNAEKECIASGPYYELALSWNRHRKEKLHFRGTINFSSFFFFFLAGLWFYFCSGMARLLRAIRSPPASSVCLPWKASLSHTMHQRCWPVEAWPSSAHKQISSPWTTGSAHTTSRLMQVNECRRK